MPALAEWMLHYPSDWKPVQAKQFCAHVAGQLTQQLVSVNMAVGPAMTTSILCSVALLMAQQNPLYARDICNILANTFNAIDGLDPLPQEGGTVN